MKQPDEQYLTLPCLVKNQITFKTGNAETANSGAVQIFAAPPDLRLADYQRVGCNQLLLKTDGKLRRNFGGKTADGLGKFLLKYRTETDVHWNFPWPGRQFDGGG